MAKEIQSGKLSTGLTVYATIRAAAGTIWNGSSLEAITAANWTTYAVTMTEESTTGYYMGTFPSSLSAGIYNVDIFQKLGGSAATTDTLVGQAVIDWTGSTEALTSSVQSTTNTLSSKLGAFTGTGTNSVFGFIRALVRSDLTAPSDIGGTFDPFTDSIQAIRDRGDIAWITATGFSTLTTSDIPTTAAIADKILGRNLAGSSDGGRTVKDALRFLRNKWVRTSTTLTVYQEDDSTSAWTSTLVAGASLDPVASSDPA